MTGRLTGFGLGLRKPHFRDFIEGRAKVDFVEAISENFMVEGGRPRDTLRKVRQSYPVALHGVSLSIGSTDGVDRAYLARLRALADEIEAAAVSDHLCWTRHGGINSHDLLPLPYTAEALELVCENLDLVQETLGRRFLLENPSSYIAFPGEMSEWAFLAEVVRRTGCGLLLDVNNIFVSAHNHGFDARAYLDALPAGAVGQMHLAGHSQGESLLIDTHDRPVCEEVWALYQVAAAAFPEAPVMIERDDDIPPLDELLAELDIARRLAPATEQELAA